MNSNSIQLSGKFEIPETLEIDNSYSISFSGGVTSISKHSQENGEYEYVYHIKAENGGILATKGRVVKFIKKGSQAQKLRFELQGLGRDYDKDMSKLLNNLDQVLDLLDKL